MSADGRASDGTTLYGYDDLYRLTSVNGPESTESYTYDPLGNRRTSLGVTGSWVYNANNELLSYGTTTIQYDLNGNTTQKTGPDGVWTYLWDTENRLTEVRKDTVLVATYLYDPFGRRLTKTVHEGQASKTTHFAYADEGLVAELNETGAVTKAYGYYPNGTWTTNPLYLWSTEATPAGEYYWYLNDHLGTPKALTDELGQLVWSATSEAFGKTTVAAGSTITNNLRFPGQYEDGESGENYNYNRYYSAGVGRYETNDPIGLRGGMNLYGFVRNNPLNSIDPSGLLVYAVFDSASGMFTVTDFDTGEQVSMYAESGGKPWGEPIPKGTYEILDHPNPDYFRLDAVDTNLRNDVVDVSGRDRFRLHKPGNTTGCIAAKDEKDWQNIRDLIRNTKTITVDDNVTPWWKFWKIWGKRESINYFGTLTVR